jgi:hypothetical protein
MVIEPAVRLTEEVLWAANRTLTVQKVVMTSSIGDARYHMPYAARRGCYPKDPILLQDLLWRTVCG